MKLLKKLAAAVVISFCCHAIAVPINVEQEVDRQMAPFIDRAIAAGKNYLRPTHNIQGISGAQSIASLKEILVGAIRNESLENDIPREGELSGANVNYYLGTYITKSLWHGNMTLEQINAQIDVILDQAAELMLSERGRAENMAAANLNAAKKDMKLWCSDTGFWNTFVYLRDNKEILRKNDIMKAIEDMQELWTQYNEPLDAPGGNAEPVIRKLYNVVFEQTPKIESAIRDAIANASFEAVRSSGRISYYVNGMPRESVPSNWEGIREAMVHLIDSELKIFSHGNDYFSTNVIFQERDVGKIREDTKAVLSHYHGNLDESCKEISKLATKDCSKAFWGIMRSYFKAKRLGVQGYFFQNSQAFSYETSIRECLNRSYIPQIDEIADSQKRRFSNLDAAKLIEVSLTENAVSFDINDDVKISYNMRNNFKIAVEEEYFHIKSAEIYLTLQAAGVIRTSSNIYELLNKPLRQLYRELTNLDNTTLYDALQVSGFDLGRLDRVYSRSEDILETAITASFKNSLRTNLAHEGVTNISVIPDREREKFRQSLQRSWYFELSPEGNIGVNDYILLHTPSNLAE